MQSLDDFDELVLFNIATEFSVPELLKFCRTNKRIDRLICQKDPIWNYNLHKHFPKESKQRGVLLKDDVSAKSLFQLLSSLSTLKEKLNSDLSLWEIHNTKEMELKIKTIPREIGVLSNLQFLYLSYNRIETIPKELGNLTDLRLLDLSHNEIIKIPKEMGNLHNLGVLYLNWNKIKEIPKELGNLSNLRMLDLSWNQIKEIPDELSNLVKLERIDLSNNPIKKGKVRIKGRVISNTEVKFK